MTQTEVGEYVGERAGSTDEHASHLGRADVVEAVVPAQHEQRARRGETEHLQMAEHARHGVLHQSTHLVRGDARVHEEEQQRVGHQAVAPVHRPAGRLAEIAVAVAVIPGSVDDTDAAGSSDLGDMSA